MPVDLCVGLAVGLMAEVAPRVSALDERLTAAEAKASLLRGQIEAVSQQVDAQLDALRRNHDKAQAARAIIGSSHARLTSLHHEVATLTQRSDQLLEAYKQSTEQGAQAQLRGSRGEVMVTLEDRQKDLQKLSGTVGKARSQLQTLTREAVDLRHSLHATQQEMDKVQGQLADPRMYFNTFEARSALAHCTFFVDRDAVAWQGAMVDAIAPVVLLHRALRERRYRLDINSDVVGGRSLASAEAMYAYAAMGHFEEARDLFALVAAPDMFFHDIFHVFRLWCLGLWLRGEHGPLKELVQLYQYAEGLAECYAQGFIGLLERDEALFGRAMRALVQREWAGWQGHSVRGLGVVNVNAVAMCRIARELGLALPSMGPQVPLELVAYTPLVTGGT